MRAYTSPSLRVDAASRTRIASHSSRTSREFGWSVWAYVPMFLATCFLLADAMERPKEKTRALRAWLKAIIDAPA